jgi:hypothetical protein
MRMILLRWIHNPEISAGWNVAALAQWLNQMFSNTTSRRSKIG